MKQLKMSTKINKNGITSMNEQELECINLPIPCNNEANRLEKSNMYDNEGNEKTLNTSENKEKERYGYVSMYE